MSEQAAQVWRGKYDRERRKSRFLLATAAMCAAAAVALGAWGASRSTGMGAPVGAPPFAQAPNGAGMPDLPGMMFKDDGTVDTVALQQILARWPAGGIEGFLEFAAQNGQLDAEQVEKLRAAAGELR